MPKRRPIIEPAEKQLERIVRLLTLLLIKLGASQSEIGIALNKDQADVSRYMPVRRVKKFQIVKNGFK